MSLSPWDLGADISFDFSLYRPRRASYVYATRSSRGQRNESYRHATKQSSTGASASSSVTGTVGRPHAGDDGERQSSATDQTGDGRRSINRKKRPESYRAAMKPRLDVKTTDSSRPNDSIVSGSDDRTVIDLADNGDEKDLDREDDNDDDPPQLSRHSSISSNAIASGDEDHTSTPVVTGCRCTKNLIALSVGFVLIFSAFRALQNVASLLHGPRVGSAALACVHGMALITGLLAPALVNRVGPRWAVVIGAVGYPVWIVANLCVTGGFGAIFGLTGSGYWAPAMSVMVLMAASLFVGIGQSVAWGSQVSYIYMYIYIYIYIYI